jgi:hypothetical protein
VSESWRVVSRPCARALVSGAVKRTRGCVAWAVLSCRAGAGNKGMHMTQDCTMDPPRKIFTRPRMNSIAQPWPMRGRPLRSQRRLPTCARGLTGTPR